MQVILTKHSCRLRKIATLYNYYHTRGGRSRGLIVEADKSNALKNLPSLFHGFTHTMQRMYRWGTTGMGELLHVKSGTFPTMFWVVEHDRSEDGN